MQHSFPPPRSTELSLLLAWSFALPNGTIESTPLVHDGTMFILAPSGRLQALDAATGGFIWEYRYETPSGDRPAPLPARSIALYGDAVLMTTRSEEHTSELQSLMRISYAVFCLKKKNLNKRTTRK